MATNDQIVEILTALAAAFPRHTLTDANIEIYQKYLRDIDIDLLKAATAECITKSKFFPAVSELRDKAVDIRRQASGLPSAAEAWGDVLGVCKRGETWQDAIDLHPDWPPYINENRFAYETKKYQWLHPLCRKVAVDLGWPAHFPTDNPVADRSQYIRAYDNAVIHLLQTEQQVPEVRKYISENQKKLQSGFKKLAEGMRK